jgi:hypothetical protein
MMELRQASKDEVKGDVQAAENANTGATFSKLQQNLILEVTEYYVKLSLECYVYNITHLLAINQHNQSVSACIGTARAGAGLSARNIPN